jgi:hypothetical protein
MREHPIIFSGEMVRAILDGRKSQTRRVIKPQPWEWVESITFSDYQDCWQGHGYEAGMKTGTLLSSVGGPQKCPYGKPGDLLWCKEVYQFLNDYDNCKPSEVDEYALIRYSDGTLSEESPIYDANSERWG